MGSRRSSSPVAIRRLAIVAGVVLLLLPGCGRGPRLEFHDDEAGNFRALMMGRPEPSQQALATPAGTLQMNAVESVDADGVRRIVGYIDLPPDFIRPSDPEVLLDAGLRKMRDGNTWTIEARNRTTIDGHPGREVWFGVSASPGSEAGSGRARIFLIGERLYQIIMVGPAAKVSQVELDHFVKSFELLRKVPVLVPVVKAPPTAPTAPPAAPTLVAQTAPPPSPPPAAVEAPPPEPAPSAEPPAPEAGPGPALASREDPAPAGSAGTAPLPSRTSRDRPSRATGDSFFGGGPETAPAPAGDAGPDLDAKAEVPIMPRASGHTIAMPVPDPNGNPNERFQEAAPDGGVLVGLRIGFVDAFGGAKVGAVQAIYQVGDRYVAGEHFGADVPLTLKVVARPGYAVGGIRTQTGLLLDAFQVVLMKARNGRLDLNDAYPSEWLGDPRGGGPGIASGRGKRVVGIHGRTTGREINMLGLLVIR